MNWILIVVLAILIGNALVGLRVGFIKTVFSLVSMVIALILTIWISPNVNDMLKNNDKFYHMINDRVEKMLSLQEEKAASTEDEQYIEGLPIPKSWKKTLIENKKDATDNLKGYIAEYVTGVIINALAFILTFVAALIVLWALCFALNIVSKLPLLNQINKLAGLAAGLVHGLVLVWLLFILLTVFGSAKFGQEAFVMIEDNAFLSLIYNNNLLLRFVTSASKLLL